MSNEYLVKYYGKNSAYYYKKSEAHLHVCKFCRAFAMPDTQCCYSAKCETMLEIEKLEIKLEKLKEQLRKMI